MRCEVAVVTGGSGGIGRATCLALSERNVHVVVVGRTSEHVSETMAAIQRKPTAPTSLGLVLDVRQESDMAEMVRATLGAFGRVDALVASAGVARAPASTRLLPYGVAQLPIEEWDLVVDTNLRGTFLSNRAVLPVMMAQRSGQIVNVGSARAALHGEPFAAAYCASKHGVLGLSQALAEEAQPYGVRVQVVHPEFTDTPMLRGTSIAVRQLMPAEEIAALIARLLTLPDDSMLGSLVVKTFPGGPE